MSVLATSGMTESSFLRASMRVRRTAMRVQPRGVTDAGGSQPPDGDEPGNQLQIKTLKGIVWPDAVTNDEGRTTVNPRSIANVAAAVRAAAGELRWMTSSQTSKL